MKKPSLLNDYLSRYAADKPWKIYSGSLDHIEQAVVIPAFAEKKSLFKTLAALAANTKDDLQRTLVLCVVNNKAQASQEAKEDNAQTLRLLSALIGKESLQQWKDDIPGRKVLDDIADSSLRLACVDASSQGLEIPEHDGGVGMARKIGLDKALAILNRSAGKEPALMISLDADTLVRPDYLSAVRRRYASNRMHTGVIAYAHQLPDERDERDAIISYEIFLRYWVLGLQYARSPYAFHSIGSTIVTTAADYLGVRGMNRRAAGEDFYFLNKLAKTGSVERINETVVYPSGRISGRVPFGTGAAVGKIISGTQEGNDLYDPRVFIILKEWIDLIRHSFGQSVEQILKQAGEIDTGLTTFLKQRGFASVWPKILANARDDKTCIKNFHHWFDGFETLKLVNELTRTYYPRVNRQGALPALLKMFDAEWPGDDPEILLAELRKRT